MKYLLSGLLTVLVGSLIFILQPFGLRWPLLVAVATALGLLQLPRMLGSPGPAALESAPGRPRRSTLLLARRWVSALFVIWLGLIAWAEASPGGQVHPSRRPPEGIRVVTWNILRGRDDGLPGFRGGWPARKEALATAIGELQPDILCVQEALPGQLDFLAHTLPTHQRAGVGRDDGRAGGEHCAIFFDRMRFDTLDEGTFWLEEPSDRPAGWRLSGPKRICTWVRLRDTRTGRTFRACNTHLYLTEASRQRAVRLILEQLDRFGSAEPLLLAGDFNATDRSPSRRLLALAGLDATATLANAKARPTYQFYGIRLRSLDEILADSRWTVLDHQVVDVKPRNRYPSDHFGVMADLMLKPAAR